MQTATNRIKGFDIARALAIFIMVFVNFQLVLAGKATEGFLVAFFNSLSGKGSALFVVLAGAGMSLMVKVARQKDAADKLWNKQRILLKRAAFLFVFGLLYVPLWPADILHFYGFYLSVGALMLTRSSLWLWLMAAALVLVYPFILSVVDYEAGWNWETLEYARFWSPTGFLRNLFINGFHPVIPWVAFVLAGVWLGRQDLTNIKVQKRILLVVGVVFTGVQIASAFLVNNSGLSTGDAAVLFGTSPMPPLPFYMISGTSGSVALIVLCIMLSERVPKNRLLDAFASTGQLAFTHYIGHVVIGIIAALAVVEKRGASLAFAFWYSLSFCAAAVVFSWLWRKQFKRGPMSWLMRRVAG